VQSGVFHARAFFIPAPASVTEERALKAKQVRESKTKEGRSGTSKSAEDHQNFLLILMWLDNLY
jgi:hypothetical protein